MSSGPWLSSFYQVQEGDLDATAQPHSPMASEPVSSLESSSGTESPSSYPLASVPSQKGTAQTASAEDVEATFAERAASMSGEVLLEPGTLIAERYRIISLLGKGGSGAVFEAQDEGPLQRRVAVKLMHIRQQELSAREGAQRRFLSEIRVAGELNHPHIVTVHDAGVWQGHLFMVQALMAGRDLSHLLSDGPLSLERALAVMDPLCDAASTLHGLSILHLDIKPGNILLDQENHIKLGDFDLARMLRNGYVYPDGPRVGTVGYMSPEQIRGDRLDVRADVFSLGCVLYLLVTGQPAFPGKTREQVLEATLGGWLITPSELRPELPAELDRVILRALATSPERRYPSAQALALELRHYAHFSQLLPLTKAVQLLEPSVAAGSVAVIVGTSLPLTHPMSGSQTQRLWLELKLRAQFPDEVLPSGLEELLKTITLLRGRDAVSQLLVNLLETFEPEPWLSALATLRPRIIVTTRMDDCIALVLARNGIHVERCCLQDDPRVLPEGAVVVLHLLGCVSRPETLLWDDDDAWSQLATLERLGDALRSRLATSFLLYCGLDEPSSLARRLADMLALDRSGSPPHGLLCQYSVPLETLRWTARRGLGVVEADPLALLEAAAERAVRVELTALDVPIPKRPYKRLDHFCAEDERIFFGRNQEVQRLNSLIQARAMCMLFGPSGAGKSSLLHAGLIPLLTRSGYDVLVVRPFESPEVEVAAALEHLLMGLDDGNSGTALDEGASPPQPLEVWEKVARVAQQTRLLVIFFDQSEELFVRHTPDTRHRLAELVRRSLEASRGRLRWVWCLREDYLPRMAELQLELPNLFHNTFQLRPLTQEQARTAIIEPAKRVGIEVELGLAAHLLAELSTDGIEPPQLQLVCDTLYDSLSPGAHRMTLEHCRALGGVPAILGGYLDRMVQTFPGEERAGVKRILMALVSGEGTRCPSRLEEVSGRAGVKNAQALGVLLQLIQLRLLRRIGREDGDWFELAHEYLVREILTWQDDAERERRRLRQLLENGVRNHRAHGLLLPSSQLILLEKQLESLEPSDEERALIRRSRAELWQSRRRQATWGTLTVLLVAALLMGGRYLHLTQSRFLRLDTRDLTALMWDERESFRDSAVVLYQGLPVAGPLDTLLGFPRRLEELPVDTEALSATGLITLQKGLPLANEKDLLSRLEEQLAPDLLMQNRVLDGQWDEAVTGTITLLGSGLLDAKAVGRLLPFMAVSGPPNRALVDAALLHAEQAEQSRGQVEQPLATRDMLVEPYKLMLSLSPKEWWQERVQRWLERRSLRPLGIQMLGFVGDDSEGHLLTPFLRDEVYRGAAMLSLRSMNACSTAPEVLTLVETGELVGESTLTPALELIGQCGGNQVLERVEKVGLRLQSTPNAPHSAEQFRVVLRTLRLLGHRALGDYARVLVKQGLDPLEVPRILCRSAALEDQSAVTFLKEALRESRGEARSFAASRLAGMGNTEAVPFLWDVVQREKSLGAHPRLWALGFYSSPALSGKLLALAARENNNAFIRAGLVRALTSVGTSDALNFLTSTLSDPDLEVAEEARETLLRFAERHKGLGVVEKLREQATSPNPGARLRSARLVQALEKTPNIALFQQFLEQEIVAGSIGGDSGAGDSGAGDSAAGDATVGGQERAVTADQPLALDTSDTDATSFDLALHLEAVGGLVDALTQSPPEAIWRAMDSPASAARRAAILAAGLEPHRNAFSGALRVPEGLSVRAQDALKRARWLASTAKRIQGLQPTIDQLTRAGKGLLSGRWVNQVSIGQGSYRQAVQEILNGYDDELDPLFDWALLSTAEFFAGGGEPDWAINRIDIATVSATDDERRRVLDNRPMPELSHYFRYRQIMNLDSPRPLPQNLEWTLP